MNEVESSEKLVTVVVSPIEDTLQIRAPRLVGWFVHTTDPAGLGPLYRKVTNTIQ